MIFESEFFSNTCVHTWESWSKDQKLEVFCQKGQEANWREHTYLGITRMTIGAEWYTFLTISPRANPVRSAEVWFKKKELSSQELSREISKLLYQFRSMK